ncbi:LysM peptidoglycan-binding domain-containing protein [Metabacillus halosaccharovorans]|uniref:LysM peptidoglycan-binding domain-containing protein n=1 Tax=Metabacillus halosaccharovorans TaxID=930124 RepID=UPI001C1F64B0|nr:LysM peptidoglycan-binding domain-containing protein [Metabacillus halosaccharovorans]MBU7592667.1 LysM peptidoglycan-binding domain-containing protein [Metabacillus halosaccharovorans]
MDNYPRFKLERMNNQNDEYKIILYLDNNLSEFSNELGTIARERKGVITIAKQIVKVNYPNLKVKMVKVIIGGIAVTSLPLVSENSPRVQAEERTNSTITQDGSVYYQVLPGDTLWILSKKFNTTIHQIKRANHLTSDILRLNQQLIIPKAFHTVETGDYLTVLAKEYGTTVHAIKTANGLTSDSTKLGQILTIPIVMNTQGSNSASSTSPTVATNKNQPTTYTVVRGDTLSHIGKRFGTTVEDLRSTNQLTLDLLRVGQTITIPESGVSTPKSDNKTPGLETSRYTVVSGDNLSTIAKRFGTTVDVLRRTNNLTTDLLRIGQILTISTGAAANPTTPSVTEQARSTFTYKVRSGDSLSVIAKRFGVTVDAIRSANSLKSNVLQIGQALKIPNGINGPTNTSGNSVSYKTHTVISGDNIWDLSVRYGIPQTELLKANKLTSISSLSIGQKLKIPVHKIGVKEVISAKNGEYLDWFSEAQYVFPIGKTAKVTDLSTGKSFSIKRTIGSGHADCETLTVNDSKIAKSVWGGYSWIPRAILVEVNGRKLAGSMTFYPHEREYIAGNGITGHFDVYFGDSIRHKDGLPDQSHQAQVERAAGLR